MYTGKSTEKIKKQQAFSPNIYFLKVSANFIRLKLESILKACCQTFKAFKDMENVNFFYTSRSFQYKVLPERA